MKKKKIIQETPTYKASIKIFGVNYTGEGATASEAISKLNVKNSKGARAILVMEYDGRKKDRLIMPNILFRLFNASKLTREIALKQVSSLFQGM